MMQPPRQILASSPMLQVPLVRARGGGHLLEALRVGDDLRGVERLADVVDQRLGQPARLRPGEHAGGVAALVAQRAESERAKTASVMPVSGTPSSSASCDVQRPVPFCSAWSTITSTSGLPVSASVLPSTVAVISIRNDSRSPLFQSSKMRLDRRHVEPDAEAQQVVGLGDQLHVGVLDAVVDHLHVVARAVGADVGAARLAVDLRGDRGEDLLDLAVGVALAARHDRRAEQRALLAAGDAGADEAQPALAAARPSRRRVSTKCELPASMTMSSSSSSGARSPITPSTGAPALTITMIRRGRSSAATNSSSDSAAVKSPSDAVLRHELARLGRRAVVDGDRHAAACDVARQVRPHHGEPGDPDLAHGPGP